MNNLMIKLVIVFMLNSIALQSFCQCVEAPGLIVIDFLSNNSTTGYTSVKHGKKYRIQINNVNLNLYKVESNLKQEDFNSDLPDIFKTIKLPGFLNLELPATPLEKDIETSGQSLDNVKTFAQSNVGIVQNDLTPFDVYEKVIIDTKELIDDNLKKISDAHKEINKYAEINNVIINLSKSCDKSYSQIERELVTDINSILGTGFTDKAVQISMIENHLITQVDNAENAIEVLELLLQLHLIPVYSTINKNNKIIFIG